MANYLETFASCSGAKTYVSSYINPKAGLLIYEKIGYFQSMKTLEFNTRNLTPTIMTGLMTITVTKEQMDFMVLYHKENNVINFHLFYRNEEPVTLNNCLIKNLGSTSQYAHLPSNMTLFLHFECNLNDISLGESNGKECSIMRR